MGKRKRKKPVTLSRPKQESPVVLIGFDGKPPMFREARDVTNNGTRVKVLGPQNINVDRLEWLLAHKLIEPHHHQAGRKLQGSCETVELSCGVSLDGGGGRSPSTTLSDAKCDALDAVNRVRAALSPLCWRMIELVVLDGVSAEKAASQMRINSRAAIPALTFCLDALGRHYGMC